MTLRVGGINPRTGLVVALCGVFLVFGFMFTVSGMKGETLGDVPLLAIGPVICLPGVAAIVLANKTKGCTEFPYWCKRPWKHRGTGVWVGAGARTGRHSKESRNRRICEDLEALQGRRIGRTGEDSVSSTTTVGESSRLIRSIERDEVLRYLQACYPSSTFLTDRNTSDYRAVDRLCPSRESTAYGTTRYSAVHVPRDTIVVYSRTRRDSNPYGSFCCYISPRDFSWGNETIV
ncbi:transmembrane protein 215-like [Scleropages formosus]|uniref:Transmembrane protein 215 n=1 Tax=Scleropages formosus TaxID=113540 RepID=A0A8C9V6D4_SCLFO|nr:transmembrane protein 215 [Scleropages formosus]